ncbi:MAG: flavodoxin domain-containing protein [Actinomycetota bacterium]
MAVLIIYHSEHHGNTEKIALAMGQVLKAEVISDSQLGKAGIEPYSLVGFGSGVYNGKFHQNMYKIADRIGKADGKKSFVFSTAGSLSYGRRANEQFKKELVSRGFNPVGDFTCPGFDTALGPQGINQGRPNDKDISEALGFAESLLE